tara:strand:+ start:3731 stop:4915 length:1185 start_codon:yes stop_codon:yes gene_type:complete
MIFPEKPQVAHSPMMGTLGGGSLRSFGRGSGEESPVFGYVVGSNSNGQQGLMVFVPEDMSRVAYYSSAAGSGMQNVGIDDTKIWANHGYSSTSFARWNKDAPATNFTSYSRYISRSAIAVDSNYVYWCDNSGYVYRDNKTTGANVNNSYYTGGELYAIALDPNYVFFGGGVNSGNIRTLQRGQYFGTVGNTNLSNISALLCITSDNDYVYCTGAFPSPYNNRDNFYKIGKSSSVGSGLVSPVHYSSSSVGYTGTSTSICVDDAWVYTCGTNNRITKWSKYTGAENTTSVLNYTSSVYGSVQVQNCMGMTHDKDHLYIAANVQTPPFGGKRFVIKVQKSNMTPVADLQHQFATDFDYYSGGRHVALDNQVGGPGFYYDSGISNWNITDRASQILL